MNLETLFPHHHVPSASFSIATAFFGGAIRRLVVVTSLVVNSSDRGLAEEGWIGRAGFGVGQIGHIGIEDIGHGVGDGKVTGSVKPVRRTVDRPRLL